MNSATNIGYFSSGNLQSAVEGVEVFVGVEWEDVGEEGKFLIVAWFNILLSGFRFE